MRGNAMSAIGNRKVAIIGVGFVGATIAYALLIRNLAREIVLIDKNMQKASGEALDIQHGIPHMGISSVYAGDYSDCADCDLIVITAGRNRQPGETRLDMLTDNVSTMRNVVTSIQKHYTRGVIVVVSNPTDVLTYMCDEWLGLPNGRVLGTGCMLDSSRLIRCVADYTQISTEAVKGFVIGEHGDSQIPVWSRLSIAGAPMNEFCDNIGLPWGDEQKQDIAKRVCGMGAEIITDKGRTHYGIATCVCAIADSVLNQRPTVASVSSVLTGEYGLDGVALSLPSIIGVNGVEMRLRERLDNDELKGLQNSALRLKKSFI